jgi:hypothetical protein
MREPRHLRRVVAGRGISRERKGNDDEKEDEEKTGRKKGSRGAVEPWMVKGDFKAR